MKKESVPPFFSVLYFKLRITRYYFELAVRYLLDPQGYGATWLDVKNIFLDMRQGLTFEQAFLNRLGMTLDYYESNFFALILDYLTQPQTMTFWPTSFSKTFYLKGDSCGS